MICTQVIGADCGPHNRRVQPLSAKKMMEVPNSGCTIGTVTCYKDHIPGPNGPYTNLLNVSAYVPPHTELTLEYCAQLCHDQNLTLAGAMYSR